MLAKNQIDAFARDGFVIVPKLADMALVKGMRDRAHRLLQESDDPLEYEVALGYPGAPEQKSAEGGGTLRRLLGAYGRGSPWKDWATSSEIHKALSQLFSNKRIVLSQAHHNCIMTKQPKYSSDTAWHQDIRYWSFERPELISVWLALGEEDSSNGGLSVVPGSHRQDYRSYQFDTSYFFREDLPENKRVLSKAVDLKLSPGDTLFFHCRLLHRASRNRSLKVKLSVVFTYAEKDNPPKAGTRSADKQSVSLE